MTRIALTLSVCFSLSLISCGSYPANGDLKGDNDISRAPYSKGNCKNARLLISSDFPNALYPFFLLRDSAHLSLERWSEYKGSKLTRDEKNFILSIRRYAEESSNYFYQGGEADLIKFRSMHPIGMNT